MFICYTRGRFRSGWGCHSSWTQMSSTLIRRVFFSDQMFYLWNWQRLLWCRPTRVWNTHVTRAQLGQLPVSKSLPVYVSLSSPQATSTHCRPHAPYVITRHRENWHLSGLQLSHGLFLLFWVRPLRVSKHHFWISTITGRGDASFTLRK